MRTFSQLLAAGVISSAAPEEDMTTATVTLTDAQIKALPTTSVQLIAAPGANKYIFVHGVSLVANIVTDGSYTNMSSPSNIGVYYSTSYMWEVDADNEGFLGNF